MRTFKIYPLIGGTHKKEEENTLPSVFWRIVNEGEKGDRFLVVEADDEKEVVINTYLVENQKSELIIQSW